MEKKETKRILNNLLVRVFNNILRVEERALQNMRSEKDLSMTEVHIIEAVKVAPKNTMSSIANFLNVTKGSLSITVDVIVKKGYIKRLKGEEDRRLVMLELTEQGEEVFKIHQDFHDTFIDEVIGKLNLNEEDVLMNSLKNVAQFFSKYEFVK